MDKANGKQNRNHTEPCNERGNKWKNEKLFGIITTLQCTVYAEQRTHFVHIDYDYFRSKRCMKPLN